MDEMRAKVQKGLQECIESLEEADCTDECPYYADCWGEEDEGPGEPMYRQLMVDALAVVQGEETRLMKPGEADSFTGHGWIEYRQGTAGQYIRALDEVVMLNGMTLIDGGVLVETAAESIRITGRDRVWIGEEPPTEEQMKGEPWSDGR